MAQKRFKRSGLVRAREEKAKQQNKAGGGHKESASMCMLECDNPCKAHHRRSTITCYYGIHTHNNTHTLP